MNSDMQERDHIKNDNNWLMLFASRRTCTRTLRKHFIQFYGSLLCSHERRLRSSTITGRRRLVLKHCAKEGTLGGFGMTGMSFLLGALT